MIYINEPLEVAFGTPQSQIKEIIVESRLPDGEIWVDTPKISAGKIGDKFMLLHVPSDRFIELYGLGQSIWEKIEKGTSDIAILIKEHSKEANVPHDTATFQIISFLDELRAQGLIRFNLPQEYEAAPLLDVMNPGVSIQNIVKGTGPEIQEVVLIDKQQQDLSLLELESMADTADSEKQGVIRIKNPREDLSMFELVKILDKEAKAKKTSRRRFIVINNPRPNLSLRDLEQLAYDTNQKDRGIVVIDNPQQDPLLLDLVQMFGVEGERKIVVIDQITQIGETPTTQSAVVVKIKITVTFTWGKSRSACKTVCV